MRPQTIGVFRPRRARRRSSSQHGIFAEQVIQATGLIDPPVDVRPARTQVDDLVGKVPARWRSAATVRSSPC